MIKNMLMELENFVNCANTDFQSDCLLLGVQSKIYQPLMKREMCGKYMIDFIKAIMNINSLISRDFKLFQYLIQNFFFALLLVHNVVYVY